MVIAIANRGMFVFRCNYLNLFFFEMRLSQILVKE